MRKRKTYMQREGGGKEKEEQEGVGGRPQIIWTIQERASGGRVAQPLGWRVQGWRWGMPGRD